MTGQEIGELLDQILMKALTEGPDGALKDLEVAFQKVTMSNYKKEHIEEIKLRFQEIKIDILLCDGSSKADLLEELKNMVASITTEDQRRLYFLDYALSRLQKAADCGD